MGHLNVAEDVVHLLGDFFPSILLVTLCVPEAPGVHPIQGVSPRTPPAMPPEVALGVSVFPHVFLDVFHRHVFPTWERRGFPWGGGPLSPGASQSHAPLSDNAGYSAPAVVPF